MPSATSDTGVKKRPHAVLRVPISLQQNIPRSETYGQRLHTSLYSLDSDVMVTLWDLMDFIGFALW